MYTALHGPNQEGEAQARSKQQEPAPGHARLKHSEMRALLLEAAQLDAAKSGTAVMQLARKYGVDEEVLRKVLRYNSMVRRSDRPAGLALEQMGFRSEEGH